MDIQTVGETLLLRTKSKDAKKKPKINQIKQLVITDYDTNNHQFNNQSTGDRDREQNPSSKSIKVVVFYSIRTVIVAVSKEPRDRITQS